MKFVVANWKMHGTLQESAALIKNLGDAWHIHKSVHKIIIAPPFPLLALFMKDLHHFGFQAAAQDCGPQKEGAFTGDVSPFLLKELGAHFVILGHSERRTYHHETDAALAQKISAAYDANLSPIVCIGESLNDYTRGATNDVLKNQLHTLFQNFKPSNHLLIAYEPLWAIGSGKTPSLTEIEKTHSFIKDTLQSLGMTAPILYGGSVTAQNAKDILHLSKVDGVLVGGASLRFETFNPICLAAHEANSTRP